MDKNRHFGIPIHFEKLNNTYEDDKLIELRVWIANVGQNHNASYFSKEVLTKMAESLPYTPVTGYIGKNSFDEKDFRGHEEELLKIGNEYDFKYLGFAYGIVPADPDWRFEVKECPDGESREYLTCNILVWKKWKDVIDIFERDDWSKRQSMELTNCDGFINEDDNLFHFTSASFDALCILGNDIEPGIPFSSIDRVSFARFNKQIRTMMQEYAIFQHNQSTSNSIPNTEVDNINTPKGGNKVKKSERILELFSLSQEQLEGQLKNELSELESFEIWEDYEIPRFSFIDYYVENKVVVAYDCKEGRLVGFEWNIFGDNVEITPDSGKPFKITYEPLVVSADPDNDDDANVDIDEDDSMPMMPEDFAQLKIEKLTKEFEAEKESLFAEKEQFTTQIVEKDQQITEKADAYIQLTEEFESLKSKLQETEEKFSVKETELAELVEFKKSVEIKERESKVEETFAKFAKVLSKEEMESLREKQSSFEKFEDFEKEVKCLVADRLISNHKDKSTYTVMEVVNNHADNVSEIAEDLWTRLEKNGD